MAAPLGQLRFRRLLVALDGSASAELALSAAVTAARRDNAAIALLCVAPDVIADAMRWPWPAPVPAAQGDADKFADGILRDAVARIPEDIPVTMIIKRGRPGHEIVAHAKESDYDAILLGARGVGRVEALVGSVSQYVMHHATIAVFVAHAPPEEADA
ncbi:MAG TPA: universal stress protein [Thermoleophilaceae bacterium]|jgi:nucleotide-binding universal stress UspA family protein|nr:universal stress protein [Thermoleophilaceae bacterium]